MTQPQVYWLDAQLPPALAPWLTHTFGVEAYSAAYLGLRDAEDEVIFQAARQADAIIISKDSDFLERLVRLGPPPRLLYVTCGNTTKARLTDPRPGIDLHTITDQGEAERHIGADDAITTDLNAGRDNRIGPDPRAAANANPTSQNHTGLQHDAVVLTGFSPRLDLIQGTGAMQQGRGARPCGLRFTRLQHRRTGGRSLHRRGGHDHASGLGHSQSSGKLSVSQKRNRASVRRGQRRDRSYGPLAAPHHIRTDFLGKSSDSQRGERLKEASIGHKERPRPP